MPASRPPWMLRRTRGVWSTPVASRGGTGVRVRRVLLPGRHQLQARRREDGPRATGASMGADAEFVARAARPAPHQPADAVALAIELALFIPPARPERRTAAPASPQLLARLVRSGRTGWVGNGMTWSRLESPYNFGDCCTSHVRLLRELYALHKSRTRTTGYYASDDKMTDLAAFGSRRLWSVLDEAADIGLQIAPVLRLAGADEPDAMPVLFIGAEGHGVVHVSRRQVQGNPNAAE